MGAFSNYLEEKIVEHFLRNNDVIELGKYKLKYMTDLQSGAAASDFEKNVLELYMSGKDYIAIAQMLDKPPKSIDNAMQRVKKKIVNYLWN